jgi:hypothetical protein
MAANRTKTIEWMMPMVTAPTSEGTTHTDSADSTIYIPETTSRAFLSVTMDVVVHDLATTAVDVTAWSLRGSCDAGSNWTTVTNANGYANTGESIANCFLVNMTAEFTARFGTGTTGTFRYGFYLDLASANNWSNLSIKLYITYEYDDTAHTTTRVKTVRIPIESFNGRLSNAAQIVRQGDITGQIPALDTFLPEASKAYRQVFAELWTLTLPSATTDATLSVKIGTGGGTTSFGTVENGLTSPLSLRFLWDLTSNADLTTNATHDIYANHEVASQSYFLHLGGWITVTYEYNASTSTTIMNSLLYCIAEGDNNVRTSGDLDKDSRDIYIEEPDTVTMAQSGIFVRAQTTSTSTTFNIGVGGQTVTGYTPTSGGNCAGMTTIMHRIDSGGYRGSGLTMTRGKNVLTVQWYADTADRICNVTTIAFINYTSGKHTSGDGVHNHSTHWLIFPNSRATATNLALSATVTPKIIESDYFQISSGVLYGTGIGSATPYFTVQAERAAGEGVEAGWETLSTSVGSSSNERSYTISYMRLPDKFRRWPTDTDTKRLNIETARTWRIFGVTQQYGMCVWTTHHSITFTISGIIKYYTGDGSGLTVYVHRNDTQERVLTCTTTAGGAYTGTWYDNTIECFAEVQQDATHAGRSRNGTAV